MNEFYEYFLSVNNYLTPTEVKDEQAIYVLLVRIIIMDPGESDINPDMGVGIYTKWRYCNAEKIPELEAEITNQVCTYLPRLSGCQVSISLDSENVNLYIINIKISDILYTFKIDTLNKTVNLVNLIS